MALSDRTIKEQLDGGDIVIEPFKESNLNTSSYDVSLGEYFFREKKRQAEDWLYNIYNQDETAAIWGTEAQRARTAKELMPSKLSKGISEDDRVILIEPGETVLAHTNEFIGAKNHITTMMKARSSLGRSFIEVCKCAGWGDVGYINRWTMEITNNSQHYRIPLVVGRRIAQIIFFETGPVLGNYGKSGKYQIGTDIEKLKKEWDPLSMLPRLYKDSDVEDKTL